MKKNSHIDLEKMIDFLCEKVYTTFIEKSRKIGEAYEAKN